MSKAFPIPKLIIKWLVDKTNEHLGSEGSQLRLKEADLSARYNRSSQGADHDTVLFSSGLPGAKEKLEAVAQFLLTHDIGSSSQAGQPKQVFEQKGKFRLNFSNLNQFDNLVQKIESELGVTFDNKPWQSDLDFSGRLSMISGTHSAFGGVDTPAAIEGLNFTQVAPPNTPRPVAQVARSVNPRVSSLDLGGGDATDTTPLLVSDQGQQAAAVAPGSYQQGGGSAAMYGGNGSPAASEPANKGCCTIS